MRSRFNIFKIAALALCSLYLLSSFGITLRICACANSKQLSFLASPANSCCSKKQASACCNKQQSSPDEHNKQVCEKSCCTAETISLTAEHQPEQARLSMLPTDFFHPPAMVNASEPLQILAYNDATSTFNRQAIPPKIPLIYQHSRLRL